MHIRVVRFTDASAERLETIKGRVESDGPPPGVEASGIKVLLDEEQGTAVVLQFFEDEEKMRASEAALEGMDPTDTPGTRASVDRCEVIAGADA
ncbi:MAG TPA: hypothetical protein VFY99_04375 [Solirubrobacterales bacterium]